MGIKGAAIATCFSESIGALFLICLLLKKNYPSNTKEAFQIPKLYQIKDFLKIGGPLFIMHCVRSLSFACISHAISSAGTSALAAFQIMYHVMFLLNGFGESVSVAVQTFLPTLDPVQSSHSYSPRRNKFLTKVLRISLTICSIASFAGCFVLMKLPYIFTSDSSVVSQIRWMVPGLFCILMASSISLPLEGVLISTGESQFLSKATSGMSFLLVTFLYVAKSFFSQNIAFAAWYGLLFETFSVMILFWLRVTRPKHKAISLSRCESERVKEINLVLHETKIPNEAPRPVEYHSFILTNTTSTQTALVSAVN